MGLGGRGRGGGGAGGRGGTEFSEEDWRNESGIQGLEEDDWMEESDVRVVGGRGDSTLGREVGRFGVVAEMELVLLLRMVLMGFCATFGIFFLGSLLLFLPAGRKAPSVLVVTCALGLVGRVEAFLWSAEGGGVSVGSGVTVIFATEWPAESHLIEVYFLTSDASLRGEPGRLTVTDHPR